MLRLSEIWHCTLDVLLPRECAVCKRVLTADEHYICNHCSIDLPRTQLHLHRFNTMEQLFGGKTPIEKACGYFFYEKDSPFAAILHDIKYRNRPQMGKWFAERYAEEVKSAGYWSDIDYIIPVPLHWKKRVKRGYNQSEYIALGISRIIGAPVLTDAVKATRPHSTQTHKGIYERWLNTQGLYAAEHAERLAGKHVLIVDDVVTTGATLLSCALTIADVPGIKISLATLAVARLD